MKEHYINMDKTLTRFRRRKGSMCLYLKHRKISVYKLKHKKKYMWF